MSRLSNVGHVIINRSHSFDCRDCFDRFGDNRSRLRNWYNVWSLCWTACGFFDVRHNWEQLSVQVNYFFEVYVAVALCRWRRFLISWGIRERSTGRNIHTTQDMTSYSRPEILKISTCDLGDSGNIWVQADRSWIKYPNRAWMNIGMLQAFYVWL